MHLSLSLTTRDFSIILFRMLSMSCITEELLKQLAGNWRWKLKQEATTGSLIHKFMVKKYTYTPEIPEVFRCRVPLPETHQAFVMNGILREDVVNEEGLTIVSNGDSGFVL